MAFLKQEDTCDNCGKSLEDVETPVEDGNHEFCSEDCKESYEESHGHDDGEEEEICEFC